MSQVCAACRHNRGDHFTSPVGLGHCASCKYNDKDS